MTQEVSLSDDASAVGDVLAVFNTTTVLGDRCVLLPAILFQKALLLLLPRLYSRGHDGRKDMVFTTASFPVGRPLGGI